MTMEEAISKSHITVDSNTAKQIADEWITYKYVAHFSEMGLIIVMFLVVPLILLSKAVSCARRHRQAEKERYQNCCTEPKP